MELFFNAFYCAVGYAFKILGNIAVLFCISVGFNIFVSIGTLIAFDNKAVARTVYSVGAESRVFIKHNKS